MVSTVITVFCHPCCLVITGVAAAAEVDPPLGSLSIIASLLPLLVSVHISSPLKGGITFSFLTCVSFLFNHPWCRSSSRGVVAVAAIVLAGAVVLVAAALHSHYS